jgi:hypothetical protein
LQEQLIGWDPTEVNRVIDVPERLYILFLFLIIVTVIARALRLYWRLGSFSVRKRISEERLQEITVDAPDLAVTALKNGFDKKLISGAQSFVPQQFRSELLRRIESANIRFRYLWQSCLDDVKALKRCIRLALLLVGLIVFDQSLEMFRGIAESKVFGFGAMHGGLANVCALASIGLTVRVGVYLISMWFEGMLVLRRTRWDYLFEQLTLTSKT